MTQRSDYASALGDLRILEGEPGVQQRWQEIIRRVITAMEAAQDLLPAEAPPPMPVEAVKPVEPEPALVEEEPEEEVEEDEIDHVGKPTGAKVKVKSKAHAAASHHKGK